MLPKKQRIRRFKEFESVFKNSYSNYNLTLGFKSSRNSLGITRFGIIVGTKVSKLAVRRNLLKRRLRALAKDNSLKIKTGFDIVVIALPRAVEADYCQTEAAFILGLQKLRLFK